MFKSRSTKDHEQALALIGMGRAIAGAAASGKGKGAERLEAMAQVIAALGFDAKSIKSVTIDWKTIYISGSHELVPVLKMESGDGGQDDMSRLGDNAQW